MKKKQQKRCLTFMLSLMLIFSMAFSVPVHATGNVNESDVETTSDNAQSTTTTQKESSIDDASTPLSQGENTDILESISASDANASASNAPDTVTGVDAVSNTDDSTLKTTSTDSTENDLEPAINVPAPQADDISGTTDNGEQFDVTPPTIEKVELIHQGETIKAGDTVYLYVYAYDADTPKGELTVTARLGSSIFSDVFMKSSYDAENDRYECSYTLPDSTLEKLVITYISVKDKYHTTTETCSENADYKYWFSIEQKESVPIHVKAFSLTQNGQTLNTGGKLEVALETTEAIKNDYTVHASFRHASGHYINDIYLTATDSERKKFTGSDSISSSDNDGEWTLERVYVDKGPLSGEEDFILDDTASYGYIVKKDSSTTPGTTPSNPTIKSISLERNGEMLSAGDKVTVTVTAEAADGKTLSSSCDVTFSAAADITNRSQTVPLKLGDNGVYQGVFEITDETYPCEWYISAIFIFHEGGGVSSGNTQLTSGANYPYYVNVKNGNTFIVPTRDVSFTFTFLDENGDLQYQTLLNQKIGWRQSSKESGITFPEIKSYSDFSHTGWGTYSTGTFKEFTENTPIDVTTNNIYLVATYDKILANIDYYFINDSGENVFKSRKIVLPKGATYGDLRREAERAPAPETHHPEMTFQQWKMEPGFSDEIVIASSILNTRANAIYDKTCIHVNYEYVDTDENWATSNRPMVVEKGTTYADAIAEAQKYLPEDITKNYTFEQWTYDSYYLNDDVVSDVSELFFTAKFSGKVALPIYHYYYNEQGIIPSTMKAVVIDEGTSGQKVIEILNGWEKPTFYPGLRFKEWYYGLDTNTIVQNGQLVDMRAVYENRLIRYLIYPSEKELPNSSGEENNFESIFCQVAEIGDTITFPKTFEGYETVTWPDYGWQLQPGDTFTVEYDMTFYGYGSKTATEPETPEPETPAPSKELPDSVVDEIVAAILAADAGATIPVNMGDATVISKEILEAAKGKNVNIQLNMNGYTWTINGMDIVARDLRSVDLEVILDTRNIPNKTLQALAGSNPLRQLSLVHEGDFGFKAILTVNIGQQHSGKYGNLFYHDSAGKMVFIDAGKINSNGDVSLTFSHASDYVIVMADKQMSQADVPASIAPTSPAQGNQNQPPKTGDNSPLAIWVTCSLLALGTMISLMKKKNYYK